MENYVWPHDLLWKEMLESLKDPQMAVWEDPSRWSRRASEQYFLLSSWVSRGGEVYNALSWLSYTQKHLPCSHTFWCLFCVVFIDYNWRRKWQPTPVFLPGESQGQGSLVGSHRVGHDWSDLAEAAAALTIIYLQKNAHHVSELYSCCFMSFVNLCLYVLIVFHCMTISQYMNSFCWWIFFFPVDGFLCHFQFGLLCIGWLYPCVLGHICTHFYFIRMVFLVARFTYVWL